MKPELSEKNPYYIPKHRYYELYHFCLQYLTWKQAYIRLCWLRGRSMDLELFKKSGVSDPTAKCAEAILEYREKMDLVDKALSETDDEHIDLLYLNVVRGVSYETMAATAAPNPLPISKDEFYKKRREFFWRLSKARN